MIANELEIRGKADRSSTEDSSNNNSNSSQELQITKNNRRAYELLLRIQSQHESNRVISVSTKKIIST